MPRPNRTIWKIEVKIQREQFIEIPWAHKVLHLDWQNEDLYIWVAVNTGMEIVKKKIWMFGTGHILEDIIGPHIATIKDGPYIWHFFEGKEKFEGSPNDPIPPVLF